MKEEIAEELRVTIPCVGKIVERFRICGTTIPFSPPYVMDDNVSEATEIRKLQKTEYLCKRNSRKAVVRKDLGAE